MNPIIAADGLFFNFKCPCLCLLILSVVFDTFLKLKTLNEKYS
jgi:hypothetical protein